MLREEPIKMLDTVVLFTVIVCALQTNAMLERYRAAGKLTFAYLKSLC